MATREQIVTALFNLLAASSEFVTAGRRNTNPTGLSPAQTPALFLLENQDKWDSGQSGFNNLSKREMRLYALIYNDVGTNDGAVPSTAINNALDAIEAALKPDNMITGTMTLGGLVQAAYVEGESQ